MQACRYYVWAAFLCCGWGLSCSGDEPGAEAAAGRSERTTNVAVYLLRPDTLVQYSLLPVTARAWRDVQLSFQEGGVVLEALKEVGDRVAAGDVLARLDAELLEAAAIEAEAGLEFQRFSSENARQLFGEGTIPEQEFRGAVYQLKRAESNQRTVRERLENAVLRAPFAGEVAARHIEVGQLVQPGTPAFHLVQAGRIRAQAWVPENQIADFSSGHTVELSFEAYPERVFQGLIGSIGPAADAMRRVFPLEVHLENPEGRLRPGMIGRLEMVRRMHQGVTVMPREGVLQRETGPVAFVVNDASAHLRPIELGAASGDRVIVRAGLAFGDRVVVKGGRDLIDGDPVRVTEVLEP